MKKVSLIMMLATMLMATSCGNLIQKKEAKETENLTEAEQQPVTEVEQVQQPKVQRAAFIPTENTPDFVDAAERSVDAVVHIMTKVVKQSNTYEDFFGALLGQLYGYPGQTRNNTMVAYGSGVVLTPDGYIVTNNHVVEGADEVEVTFNNKVKKTATIIGTDPTTDLALIKVDASDLEYLTFGDSDNVRIGEWVLAVGNPFNLTSTVTAGIVSAKARNLSILGEGTSVESFIQTDAAVNPGNSGGALVNTKGELVIPYQYETPSESNGNDFHEGLCAVVVDGDYEWFSYIDKTGKLAFPGIFSQAGDFSEGLAAVTTTGEEIQRGYIDHSGKMVITLPEGWWGRKFHDGVAQTLKYDSCFVIDKTGKRLFQVNGDIVYTGNDMIYSHGLAVVIGKGKYEHIWGLMDKRGRITFCLDEEDN